jgi:hypothetical protein
VRGSGDSGRGRRVPFEVRCRLSNAGFGDRAVGIDLEAGAGEIVEEDVITSAEKSGPAVLEVVEEGLAMI